MTKNEKVLLALASCARVGGDKCEGCPYINNDTCAEQMALDAFELLKDYPNIVHCKDCKNGHILNPCDGYNNYRVSCSLHKIITHSGDWFCADGEKFM